MPEQVPPPPQNSSLLIPAHPLIGREENMKLLFDRAMSMIMGTEQDTIISRDLLHSRARLDIRSERNGVAFDKAMDTVLALAIANLTNANQVGDTEDQSAMGPQVTAEGAQDASNATIAAANAQAAANIAQLANALVPIMAGTSGVVSVQSLAAALPLVIAAAGQASGTAAK